MHLCQQEPGLVATRQWLQHRMDKIQVGLTSASSWDEIRKLQGQHAECKSLLDCIEKPTFDEVKSE
jgi:hypothetical protein